MTNSLYSSSMVGQDTPAAKRLRFSSPIITIKVGTNADIQTVHEALIQDHSPFFKAALSAKWREGQTREITLPEDEINVVSTYIDWLYRRDIPLYVDERGDANYMLLFKMYGFGWKILDKAFCNSVMDVICKGLSCRHPYDYDVTVLPNGAEVEMAYALTSAGSPLRGLLVQQYAHCLSASSDMSDTQPPEFTKDLLKQLLALRNRVCMDFYRMNMYANRKRWHIKGQD